jgi:hypothetical protein
MRQPTRGGLGADKVTVSYDYATREFLFKPSSSADTVALSSAATNNLFKTSPTLATWIRMGLTVKP